MAVDPQYQQKGIGKALIHQASIELSDAKRIWCNSRIGAVLFYKNLGFKIVGEKINIANFGERYRMEKYF
jgi:ribosomal protein S18 acetylase RimI-like enzyme